MHLGYLLFPNQIAFLSVKIIIISKQRRSRYYLGFHCLAKNSKTCLKQPLKNRQNKDLNDKW